ncbi:MAG: DUF3892 domain-containing protein [Robiginitomaculum sp.]|nr:DUF3892 domain-containing protein [Robiginitomaculum sp.]
MGKRIIDATSDSSGKTISVRLSGNSTNTPISTAIGMAERGQIEGAHVVHPSCNDPYLRTNPDGRTENSIDMLSGDK